MSAFALGNFAGPTAAGLIVQTEGFPRTTFIFFILYSVMIIVDVIQVKNLLYLLDVSIFLRTFSTSFSQFL